MKTTSVALTWTLLNAFCIISKEYHQWLTLESWFANLEQCLWTKAFSYWHQMNNYIDQLKQN